MKNIGFVTLERIPGYDEDELFRAVKAFYHDISEEENKQSHCSNSFDDDHSSDDDLNIKNFRMETSDKISIYLLDLFACFNCCHKRAIARLKEIKQITDKGQKLIFEDYNIKHIVQFTKNNNAMIEAHKNVIIYNRLLIDTNKNLIDSNKRVLDLHIQKTI